MWIYVLLSHHETRYCYLCPCSELDETVALGNTYTVLLTGLFFLPHTYGSHVLDLTAVLLILVVRYRTYVGISLGRFYWKKPHTYNFFPPKARRFLFLLYWRMVNTYYHSNPPRFFFSRFIIKKNLPYFFNYAVSSCHSFFPPPVCNMYCSEPYYSPPKIIFSPPPFVGTLSAIIFLVLLHFFYLFAIGTVYFSSFFLGIIISSVWGERGRRFCSPICTYTSDIPVRYLIKIVFYWPYVWIKGR